VSVGKDGVTRRRVASGENGTGEQQAAGK